MAAQQAKVLRVGVIRNGKIVEERILPARLPVTIGTGSRNTIVVPGSELPVSVPVFSWHGERCLLAFGPGAQGRIQGPQGEADLSALVAQGLAAKQGSGYLVPIREDQRGKLVLGDVSILWQFVTPAPEAPRPALPNFGKGSHFQSLDRLFVVIFVVSLLLHAGFYLYVVTTPVQHHEVTLEEIPDRYARILIPEKKEPPKAQEEMPELASADQKVEQQEKQQDAKKNDKKKGGDNGPDNAEKKAAHAAAVAKAVQSKGILPLLTSAGPGGRGALGDVLKAGSGQGDVATALAGAGGVVIGSADTVGMGQHKGGGQGGKAEIGSLGGTSGGGGSKVSYGAKADVKVSGSVAQEAAEVDSSDVDQAKLGAFVRARRGAVIACYENALKRNPSLKGRLRIRFTILETGSLDDVTAVENGLGPEVSACVINIMRGWRTPFRPAGGATAEIPWYFSPGG